MESLVSLLTDFGTQDSYVAEVKAVLSTVKCRFIDITHDVPAYDVRWGAFQLLRSHAYFPKGTIHFAVVDPGVGSPRKAIYVRTKDYHFVGPDNGLMYWAIKECELRDKSKAKIYEIPVEEGTLPTFHGRDVFAPFVAKLCKGKIPKLKALKEIQGKPFPAHKVLESSIEGELLGHDRFGNIVTSIPHGGHASAEGQLAGGRERIQFAENYAKISDGHPGLLKASHGFWEISCRMQSAWRLLNVELGDRVTIFPTKKNAKRSK